MSSLYQKASQILASWSGEDAGVHTNPYQVGKTMVDMIVKEIQEHGFPTMDAAAAHDSPKQE